MFRDFLIVNRYTMRESANANPKTVYNLCTYLCSQIVSYISTTIFSNEALFPNKPISHVPAYQLVTRRISY